MIWAKYHSKHHAKPLKQVKAFPFLCSCFVCVDSQATHVIIAFKSLTTGGLYLEQAILIHLLEDCRFVASLTQSSFSSWVGHTCKAPNLLHMICITQSNN